MVVKICTKKAFMVIGREGRSSDGSDFVQALWAEASAHFQEVRHLAKTDEDGRIVGIWGAMSDFSRSFKPWENNFGQGLYLAGVECVDDAEAPEGWTKWRIPAYKYAYVEREDEETFSRMIDYLNQNGLLLAGAVHDFICPQTGKNYLFFPIGRLREGHAEHEGSVKISENGAKS